MKSKDQDSQSGRFNKYVLPPPLELAKLAALLNGNDQLCREAPEAALVVAVRLFVKAVDCHEHFTSLSEDDLLLNLSSIDLPGRQELKVDDGILEIYNRRKTRREARRLYSDHARPTADERDKYFKDGLDEVRSYLMEHANIFDWKTTRAVLDNILRYYKNLAQNHNKDNQVAIAAYQKDLQEYHEEHLRKFAKSEGIQTNAISEPDKIQLRKYAARIFRPRKEQKRETGKELFRNFMRTHAFSSPVSPDDHKYDPTKPKHVAYWELPVPYLDALIVWRREVAKRPGGAKSLDSLE